MKTIYAQACPGSVVLQEKELPAPGPGQLLLEAQYSTMSPGTEKRTYGRTHCSAANQHWLQYGCKSH